MLFCTPIRVKFNNDSFKKITEIFFFKYFDRIFPYKFKFNSILLKIAKKIDKQYVQRFQKEKGESWIITYPCPYVTYIQTFFIGTDVLSPLNSVLINAH